jgi:hypothetical protein
MRLVTTLTIVLTTLTLALSSIYSATAQEYESGERWMTMGKTNEGDILSLNVNSVQTKPHAGNRLWFTYRITDGVETRESIGFTGACHRGQLMSKPEWQVEFTNQKGEVESAQVKADSPGSLKLLRTVCSRGYR